MKLYPSAVKKIKKGEMEDYVTRGMPSLKNEKDYDRLIKTIYEEEGPSLVVAKCQAKATPLVFPHSFDGSVSINRFMSTLKS